MSEFYAKVLRHHPLLGALLGLIFLLIITLGTLHALRISGELLLVIVREFKHEITGLVGVVERVVSELRTWSG